MLLGISNSLERARGLAKSVTVRSQICVATYTIHRNNRLVSHMGMAIVVHPDVTVAKFRVVSTYGIIAQLQ